MIQKVFLAIDYTIRGIALIALIPFALASLFLSVMATGSANSLMPMLLVLGVALVIGLLTVYSSLSPQVLTKFIAKFTKVSFILGRIPAYLMAYFGVADGISIVMGILNSLSWAGLKDMIFLI